MSQKNEQMWEKEEEEVEVWRREKDANENFAFYKRQINKHINIMTDWESNE